MRAAREPIRTCVGCGQRAGQPELVRVRAVGGAAVADGVRGSGRGAWLHPASACLERALKRRVLPRALRVEGLAADVRALRVQLTGFARKH